MSAADTIERAAAGELPGWACVRPERRAHMARVAALMDGWAASLGLPPDQRTRWRAVGLLHDALRDEDPGRLRPRVSEEQRALPPGLLHGPAAAARLADEGVDDEELLLAVAYHTTGHPRFAVRGPRGEGAGTRESAGTGESAGTIGRPGNAGTGDSAGNDGTGDLVRPGAHGGHDRSGRIGRFLYMADYLEPGRSFDPAGRAVLRARMPAAADVVLREVAHRRMAHLVARGRVLPEPTVRFWNALAGGSA